MAALEAEVISSASHPPVLRDYSIEFKAEAINLYYANNKNALRTANELGIGESLLRYWLSREDAYRNACERNLPKLLAKLDDNAHLLANAIPEKIGDANLSQTATALGIVIDKSQVLRNLPTSITASIERTELTVLLQHALGSAIDSPDSDQSE